MDENLSEKNIKENKMGTAPVGRLMLSMGIPMILSMMLQALYNLSLIHISEPTRH